MDGAPPLPFEGGSSSLLARVQTFGIPKDAKAFRPADPLRLEASLLVRDHLSRRLCVRWREGSARWSSPASTRQRRSASASSVMRGRISSSSLPESRASTRSSSMLSSAHTGGGRTVPAGSREGGCTLDKWSRKLAPKSPNCRAISAASFVPHATWRTGLQSSRALPPRSPLAPRG